MNSRTKENDPPPSVFPLVTSKTFGELTPWHSLLPPHDLAPRASSPSYPLAFLPQRMDTPFANSQSTTPQTNHPPAPRSESSSSNTVSCTPPLPSDSPFQVTASKESFGIQTEIVGGSRLDAQPSRTVTREESCSASNGESASLHQRFKNLFVSGRKASSVQPTAKESFMVVVRASWINLLLVFVPVSRDEGREEGTRC